VVAVRPEETRAVVWSFLYFLFLLTGYYILRPIRDERGVFVGSDRLPALYRWTFLSMLVVVPLWSALVARVARGRLLPLVYRFFVVNLVVFFLLFRSHAAERATAQVFFVWLSVFNLFAVSVFWGLMADVFSKEQGKRLFGFIAAGGSAGAILGPALTRLLVAWIEPAMLLLISALLLELVAQCVGRIVRAAGDARPAHAEPEPEARRTEAPVGGGAFSGIRVVFASPYLLAIAAYTLLASMAGTWGYNLQARLVEAEHMTPAARTAFFALLDGLVNVSCVVVQALVIKQLLTRLGAGGVLMLIPPLSSISFAALAARPLLSVAATLQVVRRTLAYGVWGPANNVLFTVVDREQKYKSKAFIDLVIYRGGDWLTSALVAALLSAGLGVGQVALAAVPLGVIWLVVGLVVSRQHQRIGEGAENLG
jgi:AAA family ATP:ADP antiporter